MRMAIIILELYHWCILSCFESLISLIKRVATLICKGNHNQLQREGSRKGISLWSLSGGGCLTFMVLSQHPSGEHACVWREELSGGVGSEGGGEETCSLSVLTQWLESLASLWWSRIPRYGWRPAPMDGCLEAALHWFPTSFLTIPFPATPALPQTHNSHAHANSCHSYPSSLVTDTHAHT